MNQVVVRIYETAGLDAEAKAAALVTAGVVLASASVDVSWKQCPPAKSMSPCDGPPTGELIVRIVHLGTERPDRQLALGDAFVDTGARSAVLATVYLDRVGVVANAAGLPVHRLLGYAIAHELGHLLMASNAHNRRGLMRPIWRKDELESREEADWSLAAEDVAAIRARLEATQADRGARWSTR